MQPEIMAWDCECMEVRNFTETVQQEERQTVNETVMLDRRQVFRGKQGYRLWKRTQDIVLSLLALLLLWPVLLVVAVIILIDSPGASPFFAQERVGKDGRIFKLYKFRSMHPHAEEGSPSCSSTTK